jgi:transketolase
VTAATTPGPEVVPGAAAEIVREDGQDQSEVFRGVTGSPAARTSRTDKGITTASIPAFVAGAELADLADSDPRIAVLTADLASANRLAEFGARHPERFFDLGIAEKNMITVAAGLASTGLITFAGTFASFAALLGMEQIRTDCAYPQMPVRILAHHSGISLGFYGTSHHALEDLAAMRAIANLIVACAADGNQLRAMLRASLDVPGAIYIRLGRGRDPEVYPAVPQDFAFGRAIRLREGSDATIIATGSEVYPALAAADILAERGLAVRVVDMHTLKPLDVAEVIAAATETGAVITVEEHNVLGGLGGAVAEVLADQRLAVKFRRHGIADEFVLIGPPAQLYAHYRLDGPGIAEVVTATCETT